MNARASRRIRRSGRPAGAANVAAIVAALVAMLASAAAPAEGQRTFRTVGEDFRNGFADMLWVWGSPLRADGDDWLAAAGVFAAGGVVGLADGEIQDWLARHPGSVPLALLRPFREEQSIPLTDLGSGKRIIPISGVLYLAGFVFDSPNLRDAAIGCAASQQVQTLTHEAAFHIVARRRPRATGDATYVVGSDPYEFEYFQSTPWGMHSFYGGHSANAMSCATLLGERFDLGVAEPVLYATAIGIGLARVADGRHWSSDTVIGIAFGHVVGRSVARRSKARAAARRGETAARDAATPDGAFVDAGARGVLIGWRRAF